MTMRALLLVLLIPVAVSAAPLESFADRPVWVPGKTSSVELFYEPAYANEAGQSVAVHSLMFDLKYGLVDGVEVGLIGGLDLSGDVTSRRIGFEIEGSPIRTFAARLDAIEYWVTEPNFYATGNPRTQAALAFGVGGTLRLPIGERFALISGRSIGRPPFGFGPVYSFSDDWLTLDLNHNDVFASVGVPVGLFFEATPGLAFQLRSGFRHVWGGGLLVANYVPVGLDGLLNLGRHFDLVATVELPGQTTTYWSVVEARVTLAARF